MDDVIGELVTWRREPDLEGVVLVAPTADLRVRIRPRIRPWRRLVELLDAAIEDARPRTGRPIAVTRSPVKRLQTSHGELAAVAHAEIIGVLASLHVSVAITGSEPLGYVDAQGPSSSRSFIERVIHELPIGASGSRPFEYSTPPSWVGLRRERQTIWLHPAYPRVPARITMFDAQRFGDARMQQLARRMFMELRGRLHAARISPPEDLHLDAGLAGRILVVEGVLCGRDVARCAATAADHRYLYAAHYEGPTSGASTFRDVFRSLRPLPTLRGDHDGNWT